MANMDQSIIDTPSSYPGKVFVLLHGSGGTPQDIYTALAADIRETYPDAAIIVPQGPYASKYPGTYQHFLLEEHYSASLFEKDPSEYTDNEHLRAEYIIDEAERAGAALNQMIEGQMESLGVKGRDVHLIGYSQGGQLALQAGLSAKKKYGSITSIFGNLLPLHKFKADNIQKPPVQLVSSDGDAVVPKISIERTESFLRSVGISTYHDSTSSADHHSWKDIAKSAIRRLLGNLGDNGGNASFGAYAQFNFNGLRHYRK